MRVALALLAIANLLLVFTSTRTERGREALVREKTGLEERLAGTEATRVERKALSSLLEAYGAQAGEEGQGRELGIAGLRDTLLGAEQGLGLERLSLEFRLETDILEGFGGSRVQTSLRGSFDAIYWYLARLESLHLPLSPAEMTLREEGDGVLSLSARWVAAWPLPGSGSTGRLSTDEVEALSRWLHRGEASGLKRDVFETVRASEASLPPPMSPETRAPTEEEPPTLAPEAAPERPVLAGFVIARPEIEPDVDRRVLAAVRFDGRLHLVGVGDSVGPYRVEAIDSRESVTLADGATGEAVLLRLE